MQTVRRLDLWDKSKCIKWLYEDGTQQVDDDMRMTLWNFIHTIFENVHRDAFFDAFVSEHYKRELNLWNYEKEKHNELTDPEQIFYGLQDVDFGLSVSLAQPL